MKYNKILIYVASHDQNEGISNYIYKYFNTTNSKLNHLRYSDITAYSELLLKNFEVKGVVQYRRFFVRKTAALNQFLGIKVFSNVITEKDIKRLLKNSDLILPRRSKLKSKSITVYSHYAKHHIEKDMIILSDIIKTYHNEYYTSLKYVMESDISNIFTHNLIIARAEIFDDYSNWLLGILTKLEEKIDFSSRDSYQSRVLGFISERLINVYITYHNLKVSEVEIRVLSKDLNYRNYGLKFMIIQLKRFINFIIRF